MKNAAFRIRIISVFILLAAFVLVAKLYDLQIVNGSAYADRANRQYVRPSQGVFDRGSIFFTDKDGHQISAATLKAGFILAINPKQLSTSAMYGATSSVGTVGLFQTLSKTFGTSTSLDEANFLNHAAKTNDTYEEVAKHIDTDHGQAIQDLKIPGVNLYQDKWRYYPGNSLAAQTLGLVGFQGTSTSMSGRYGLERYYDSTLSRNDDNLYVNFFAEIFSDIHKAVSPNQSLEGDIVTTIEPTTEAYLESLLVKVNKQYSSQSTGGIIMNPKTGEIYAMGLYPTYDPNDLSGQADPAIFSNDLVENVHEMGSIIKPLTMAAGIDVGAVSASTTYNDTGSITVNNKVISNFDKKARGITTLQQAMGQSLNVGFAFVAKKIGNKTLSDYFYKFGLGQKTGIDLPNEAANLVKTSLDSPRDIEHVTASFGQGIAMTPITTVRALSALANGGYLVTPHIVDKINYKLGYSKNINPASGPQVIKPQTAEDVTRMLVTDVDTILKNGQGKNPHYSVAAKTGTAQVPAPGGGYYPDRYLHSFFGYLPAYDPKFIIFLYTVYPKGVQYSSETLTDPFLDMTKFLINYYQLPPDR
ncbi:MAG: penicillin-binding protein 2 [Candidatus Pacebacteria bacterium]|nr:penicillin-binding protein 2 [Candidatus Paceibacterota bacterium]